MVGCLPTSLVVLTCNAVFSFSEMPRTYKRKSDRAKYALRDINSAIDRIATGEKLRKVAADTGIDTSTLSRYVRKFHEGGEKVQKVAYSGVRQVFDENMEMMLCDYLKNSARVYFGLTPLEVRKLAYELGIKNELKVETSTQLAGELNGW